MVLLLIVFLSSSEMIDKVVDIQKILVKADQTETVVGNMVKRVLKMIRDEYNIFKGIKEEVQVMHV